MLDLGIVALSPVALQGFLSGALIEIALQGFVFVTWSYTNRGFDVFPTGQQSGDYGHLSGFFFGGEFGLTSRVCESTIWIN